MPCHSYKCIVRALQESVISIKAEYHMSMDQFSARVLHDACTVEMIYQVDLSHPYVYWSCLGEEISEHPTKRSASGHIYIGSPLAFFGVDELLSLLPDAVTPHLASA